MTAPAWSTHAILEVVRRYWGFETLRPMQEQAIRAGLEHRDSLVVMPTGGGKSLCYQVPPELARRTDVVVSPLIALMKDQVDGLRACGYSAAALHSGMDAAALRQTEGEMAAGRYRLMFVAPERLLTPRYLHLLEHLQVRAFAVDEAHCISQWGHDFRPEYRQLAELKQRFPAASIHAYTATATQRVRRDIAEQLHLQDPAVLVGTFDRPNLVYRVIPRVDVTAQVLSVVRRHAGEAGIVYCLSRRDSERMAGRLAAHGVRVAAYHAGLESEQRRRTQDDFAAERIDVIAATVAFGMGIDRSNVRYVVHAAMPKSLEHYQQETGRAGRDGLEAECALFYSAADAIRWESLIEKTVSESGAAAAVATAARALLGEMRRYCTGVACRHRRLSEYFDQPYPSEDCRACDVCLGEIEGMADGTVTAQKILSCIARAGERFGAEHIIDILRGGDTERVRRWQHERLSTYGLLKGTSRESLANLLYQLVDTGLVERTTDERPVLRLNAASWAVLRGERPVRLVQPKESVGRTAVDENAWAGVDRGLFETLRALRRRLAQERSVSAYVIFSDATLREMARSRPGSPGSLARVRGVGERKLADLGTQFLAHIATYCQAHDLALDPTGPPPPAAAARPAEPSAKEAAFALFAQGRSIADVMAELQRARSTVSDYLAEFVATQRPPHIDSWLDASTYRAILQAAQDVGTQRLKPIFERLGGTASYDAIRLALAHARATADTPTLPDSSRTNTARRPG